MLPALSVAGARVAPRAPSPPPAHRTGSVGAGASNRPGDPAECPSVYVYQDGTFGQAGKRNEASLSYEAWLDNLYDYLKDIIPDNQLLPQGPALEAPNRAR